ncbi:LexA family transcriptional regulator [Pseudomonas sp. BN515]|uniref:LexA family protein n=1 Tax=Pseudomonas sp. BN515 TaxID=2567892 RepID=UPI002453E7BE|nr:LexA family transcriptional regulator [Pseudomonas sp. BN515]MDH4873035.1 peptidase S24 [Pseudomonas sp. BN515]
MSTPTERQQAIADLFKRRRQELKMSQSDVARGVSELLGGEVFKQQSYAAIESGKTKHSRYLAQIARVLGIPPQAVDPASPAPRLVQESIIPYGETATVVGETGRKLPVVGSIAAGAWCEAIDLFQPGDAEEWIESPGPVGPRAFVLQIEGISMLNTGGSVSFAPGDRVVIDPDADARPGDYVAAKVASSNSVTFKRLQCEDGEWFLEATNPDWSPRYIRMTEEWHICGKAMWKVQKL